MGDDVRIVNVMTDEVRVVKVMGVTKGVVSVRVFGAVYDFPMASQRGSGAVSRWALILDGQTAEEVALLFRKSDGFGLSAEELLRQASMVDVKKRRG